LKPAALLRFSRSPDGLFMEAHPKLRPVSIATGGVYLAGCCQGPRDIPGKIAQAKAAATAAMIPLMWGKVKVGAAISLVDEDICLGCGMCAELRTYSALALHTMRGTMTVYRKPACFQLPSGLLRLDNESRGKSLAGASATPVLSTQVTRPL